MNKASIYQKIGERIAARENEGLSQEELGRLLGNYTASSISYFENGQRKIKIEEVIKIAKIFNKDLTDLIEDGDLVQLNPEATKFRAEIQSRADMNTHKFEEDFKDKKGFRPVDSEL